MNLLPSTEKEDLKKGLKARFLIVSSILAAVSFLAALAFLSPSYLLALGNFSKISKESNLLNAKNDEAAKKLLQLPSEVNAKLKLLQSAASQSSVSGTVAKILDFLPAGVKVDSIMFSRNKDYNEKNGILVSVSGTAANREALVLFSNQLKDSNLFSTVDIPVSSLAKDKNLPFTVNIFIQS